jgi:hypothetical protein
LDDELAVVLAGSRNLARLTCLHLADNRIGPEGALARSPGLARITRLALAGPDIGPAAARALLASPHAGSLRVLSLKGAITDPLLRQALKKRFACCLLHWPFE